jgi:DNA modification methylase
MALQIVKVPLKDITPYENNAKEHTPEQIKHLISSIEQFGFNDPIQIWGPDNIIVAGHGRYHAQKKMKVKEVDCIRLDHLTDDQRKAYTLAHNKINQETGFDMEKFEEELKAITGVDLGALGFEEYSDVFGLDAKMSEGEPELDEIMESEDIFVERGDVWCLGRHRLMCGDSTDERDVTTLMNGEKSDLGIHDPPYGMALVDEVMGQEETLQNDDLTGDAMKDFLYKSYKNMRDFTKEGKSLYVFHSYHYAADFIQQFEKTGMIFEQTLIWNKPQFSLSGSLYQHKHEMILFGRNGGKASDRTWNAGRSEADVIEKKIEDMTLEQLQIAYKELADKVKVDVMEFDRNDAEKIHTCLTKGNKVFFNDKWIDITKVKIGDKNRYGEVVDCSNQIQDDIYDIWADGKKVRATYNHPFLILRGSELAWCESRRLKKGDMVLYELNKGGATWQLKLGQYLSADITEESFLEQRNKNSNTDSYGKSNTEKSLKVTSCAIRTETNSTMTFPISCLSHTLNTNGYTVVAELKTGSGSNNVPHVKNGLQSIRIIGISKTDGLLLLAENAEYKPLAEVKEYGVRSVNKIKQIKKATKVYNLTMSGIPAYETKIGLSHNTMKSVPMIIELTRNSSNQNELVQDLFSGSGTTIIACEQCNRVCYGMEISELYCTRTIKRFKNAHGTSDDIFVLRGGEKISYNDIIKGIENIKEII